MGLKNSNYTHFTIPEIYKSLIVSMKIPSKELKKLRSIAEKSLNKTNELQEVLDQIEASLSGFEIK